METNYYFKKKRKEKDNINRSSILLEYLQAKSSDYDIDFQYF